MSEENALLSAYEELPEALLNNTPKSAPLLAACVDYACQADTSDCSTDSCPSDQPCYDYPCPYDCYDHTCPSDCSDCSDCSDAPVTYPYLSSDGSDSSSIVWTVHHGTQRTYNYFRTIVKRDTTIVEDSGWGYADADFFQAIDGLASSTTYTIYLYYNTSGSGTGISGGSIDIRTEDSPSPPTYTIRATVSFDANCGSVSPSSALGEAYAQPNPYGNVLIVFPTPTRDGYTFLYWLLDGYVTHYPAGVNNIYATAGGETYTARAQWERAGTGKAYIGDGGVWRQAVPYIGDGGVWKTVTEHIGDGGTWE